MDESYFVDIDELALNDSDALRDSFYLVGSDEFHEVVQDKPLKPFVPTFPMANNSRDIYYLNRRKAESFLPIFIAMGIIMVLGILCNIVVCYIYRCRSRRSTSNFFFIFFAVFDIVGCVVGIPVEIQDLALPYVYEIVPLCKIMGFLKTWFVCSLCLTLICVSFDCYKKVCKPNEEFGVKKARIFCVIAIVAALFLSISAFFVFGTREVLTIYPGVFGKSCSVNTDLPMWLKILYYICILLPFAVSFCTMAILYGLICVYSYKKKQAAERGDKASPVKRAFPKTHRFVKEETSSSSITNEELSRLCNMGKLTYSPKVQHSSRVPLKSSCASSNNTVRSGRQTATAPAQNNVVLPLHVKTSKQVLIFIVISIVFVVFMLPFVIVKILCASTNVFENFSSNETEIVFNFCVRSYLVNYSVKPIVYLICNVNFRTEVKQLFHKLALCTRSASEQASSRQLQRSLTMSAPRSTSRSPIYRPPPNSV